MPRGFCGQASHHILLNEVHDSTDISVNWILEQWLENLNEAAVRLLSRFEDAESSPYWIARGGCKSAVLLPWRLMEEDLDLFEVCGVHFAQLRMIMGRKRARRKVGSLVRCASCEANRQQSRWPADRLSKIHLRKKTCASAAVKKPELSPVPFEHFSTQERLLTNCLRICWSRLLLKTHTLCLNCS